MFENSKSKIDGRFTDQIVSFEDMKYYVLDIYWIPS